MLLPADAGVVHRDTALPGFATLIDPDAFAAALQSSCPATDIVDLRLTSIRYKPTRSCLAAYDVDAGGETIQVYAKACSHDALANAVRSPTPSAELNPLGRSRILFKDLATVVSIFPHDDALTAPQQFADARTRRYRLGKLFPDRPDLWDGSVHRLGYVPDKRYVVQLKTSAGSKTVLKFYAASEFERAARVAETGLSSTESLRLARLLACSKRYSMLAFDWLDGQVLHQAIFENELGSAAATLVGVALAELQQRDPNELITCTGRSETARLRSIVKSIGFLCPDLAVRIDRLARLIASRLDEQPLAKCLIHGDFHAKQVLLTDQTVSILDLDFAAYGDPADDLGRLMGFLERMVVNGELSSSRLDWLWHALFEGYRRAGGRALPLSVVLYTAIGLLRLAMGPFRHRVPDWPERTQMILERAERLVTASPSRLTLSPSASAHSRIKT